MLIHYIIVRRDLPLGVITSMVCHAAGESAAKFEAKEGWRYDPQPAFNGATAVILEARTEDHLKRIAEDLTEAKLEFVPIHESGGTYGGQFMSIGVIPGDREDLAPIFREFQTLKTCLPNQEVVQT